MAIDLCGYRVDNGTALSLNTLQFRAFRYTAFASGVANKVEIKGHVTGQRMRFAIYKNDPTNSNRGKELLAMTAVLTMTAGEIIQAEIAPPLTVVSGDILHFDFVQEGTAGNNCIRAGVIPSTQRTAGATLTSIDDLPPDPRINGAGTTVTVGPYAMLIADSVGITGIDQTITGRTSTANFNAPYPPTSFSITGDGVTKTAAATIVDADSASFVIPQWEDGETAVRLGAVTISATDGTGTTTNFSATLTMEAQHPDDSTPRQFTAIELTSVNAETLRPYWQVGTQVLYDSTRFKVSPSGKVTSGDGVTPPYLGVSNIWARNPDDKIARLTILTTEENGATGTAPAMPADASLTVYEGATVLGAWAATSGTEPISYTIDPASATIFNVNASTGLITFKSAAVIGTGTITLTGTNSADSDSMVISYSVVASPTPSPDGDSRFPKGSTLRGKVLSGKTLKGEYV